MNYEILNYELCYMNHYESINRHIFHDLIFTPPLEIKLTKRANCLVLTDRLTLIIEKLCF